jgi:hypothetical protein
MNDDEDDGFVSPLRDEQGYFEPGPSRNRQNSIDDPDMPQEESLSIQYVFLLLSSQTMCLSTNQCLIVFGSEYVRTHRKLLEQDAADEIVKEEQEKPGFLKRYEYLCTKPCVCSPVIMFH